MADKFLDVIKLNNYSIIIHSLVVDYIDTHINNIDNLKELKILLDEKSDNRSILDEFDRGALYFTMLFLERRITNLDFEHKLRIQRTTINMGFAGL